MKEQLKQMLAARDVLPTNMVEYQDKLKGVAQDTLYVVGENMGNVLFPEEINKAEALKFIDYLKTIGFFSILK